MLIWTGACLNADERERMIRSQQPHAHVPRPKTACLMGMLITLGLESTSRKLDCRARISIYARKAERTSSLRGSGYFSKETRRCTLRSRCREMGTTVLLLWLKSTKTHKNAFGRRIWLKHFERSLASSVRYQRRI